MAKQKSHHPYHHESSESTEHIDIGFISSAEESSIGNHASNDEGEDNESAYLVPSGDEQEPQRNEVPTHRKGKRISDERAGKIQVQAKTPMIATTDDEKISKLARFFSLFYEPFLPRYYLSHTAIGAPALKDRYVSEDNMVQGAIYELIELVPSDLQARLIAKDAQFIAVFFKALSSARRSATNAVRTNLEKIIGSAATSLGIESHTNNSEFRRLLGVDGNEVYPIFPPILFPGGLPSTARETDVFRSEYLVCVIQAMLFGKGSITGVNNLPQNSDKCAWAVSAGNCLGKKFGPQKVTPGLVALSAVIAQYAISSDKELTREAGGSTKLMWSGRFNAYKKFILDRLAAEKSRANRRPIHTTMAWFDRVVYGTGSPEELQPAVTEDARLSQLGAEMDAESDVEGEFETAETRSNVDGSIHEINDRSDPTDPVGDTVSSSPTRKPASTSSSKSMGRRVEREEFQGTAESGSKKKSSRGRTKAGGSRGKKKAVAEEVNVRPVDIVETEMVAKHATTRGRPKRTVRQ